MGKVFFEYMKNKPWISLLCKCLSTVFVLYRIYVNIKTQSPSDNGQPHPARLAEE